MPKILWTLGSDGKRTQFEYRGSVNEGVTLVQTGNPRISAEFFDAALKRFAGREIKGGFKMDDPPVGGFGEWVQLNSEKVNGGKLSPRHGSFMAAILCAEAGVKNRLDGNAVMLRFPKNLEIVRTGEELNNGSL